MDTVKLHVNHNGLTVLDSVSNIIYTTEFSLFSKQRRPKLKIVYMYIIYDIVNEVDIKHDRSVGKCRNTCSKA